MNAKTTILIVDDEKPTRDLMARALEPDYTVVTASDADLALKALDDNPSIALMLSDIRMPGKDGVTLMREAKAKHRNLACIMLTAYGSVEQAVAAMKDGADDFLTKPVDLDQLDIRISKALTNRALQLKVTELSKTIDEKYGVANIIGNSEPMKRVFHLIQQAAPSEATILLQGPSGTGKELVAHAIHNLSTRKDGPFVAVHCAALTPTLLESELFGHEKGAFTGAVARQIGRFEAASGGTIFLDEISEIDPATQVKLLRVLETRTIQRVGGTDTINCDIRIVAATNRDLAAYVAEGKFREDLYYRLNVVDIHLPPLTERRGDIALLADKFLREFSSQNGDRVSGIEPEAMAALERYPWPGNVRELRNAIEKMVVLSAGGRLGLADVPDNIRGGRTAALDVSGPKTLEEAEKERILAVLKKNNGNQTKTAAELGISRRTLIRRLRDWGMMIALLMAPFAIFAAEPGDKDEFEGHWNRGYFEYRNRLALVQATGNTELPGGKTAAEGIRTTMHRLVRHDEECPACHAKREVVIQEPDVGQDTGRIGPRNRLKRTIACPLCKARGRIHGYRNAATITRLLADGRREFETEHQAAGDFKQGYAFIPGDIVESMDITKKYLAEATYGVPCATCNWCGFIPCRTCKGEGVVKCKGVNCKDGWVITKTQANFNSGRRNNRREEARVSACDTCGGVALVTCATCNGARLIPCNRCGGEGIDRKKIERIEMQIRREEQKREREAAKK